MAEGARASGVITGLAALLCLCALTFMVSASAALPDPVRFGVAVERGDLATVGQWLDDGLDPDFPADRIGSGLMIAAWEGNLAMLELFHKHGARVDFRNRYDEQALQMAAWKGHLAAVEWLLAHGAKVNRDGHGWGALHYAAFANREDVVRLLLQRGGDVNGRSPNGSTALMMTAREGRDGIAALLLEAGADPQLTNERGDSALTWAMRQQHFRIAQQVSTPAMFAKAVKADPESFGTPVKSQPAPPEIEEILRQIRVAEATAQPTEALRKKLFEAIARFKKDSELVRIDKRSVGKKVRTGKPKALVITARRGKQPGRERAELTYAPREAPVADAAPDKKSAQPLPGSVLAENTVGIAKAPVAAVSQPSMPELLERIERARAAGKPTGDLRKALFEAIARFKNEAPGESGAEAK